MSLVKSPPDDVDRAVEQALRKLALWVRAQAGIAVNEDDYGQLGVVANFSCDEPHRGVAFQWFQRDGVLALLPLPGRRVSMVWSVVKARAEHLLTLTGDASQEVEINFKPSEVGTLDMVVEAERRVWFLYEAGRK